MKKEGRVGLAVDGRSEREESERGNVCDTLSQVC